MITIRVTAEEVLALLSENRRWPGRFSCNRSAKVWPVEYFGLSNPDQRDLIDGHPLLDMIVEAVLASADRGGQFQVSSEGVRFASTGELVVVFSFVRERDFVAPGYL